MSLVCTVTSTPAPKVSWWYRGLFINNGSTMVSDIGECQGPSLTPLVKLLRNSLHYTFNIFLMR